MFLYCCQAYFTAASELHGIQIKALLSTYSGMVKKAPTEEEAEGKCYGRASDVVSVFLDRFFWRNPNEQCGQSSPRHASRRDNRSLPA